MPDNKRNKGQNIKVETGRVEGKRTVRYVGPDGKELYKIGGSKAWRNNNPGNVGCSRYMEELGAIGCDAEKRSIFPDYKTGDRAMERLLRRGKHYKGKTLEEIIGNYAPKKGGNPTEKYIEYTSKKTGMPRDKDSDDMTGSEFNSMRKTIKEFEQTNPGKLVEVYKKGGETTSLVREPVNVKPGKHYDLSKVEYDVKMKKGAPISFTGGKNMTIKRRSAPADKSPSSSTDNPSRGRKSRPAKSHARKSSGCKETLVREGQRVIRKEADCGTRGSFVS